MLLSLGAVVRRERPAHIERAGSRKFCDQTTTPHVLTISDSAVTHVIFVSFEESVTKFEHSTMARAPPLRITMAMMAMIRHDCREKPPARTQGLAVIMSSCCSKPARYAADLWKREDDEFYIQKRIEYTR
jgi:hypothetical protein